MYTDIVSDVYGYRVRFAQIQGHMNTDIGSDVAVQVVPMQPMLKAPGSRSSKLKHDQQLSSYAFRFNLCRCIEGDDGGGGFPYDLTQLGAEALAGVARKRRVQTVPSDLQLMLAARAAGISSNDDNDDDEGEESGVVCLVPDEMSEATRRRWAQAERGAAMLVLLKRPPAAAAGAAGAGAAGAAAAGGAAGPARVVFAVAGRCSADGLALSPTVSVEEAQRLLARLSEVAGTRHK